MIHWNLLSKYRSELMGLSTIAIVLFHYCEVLGWNYENISIWKQYLYSIGRYGYIGVEVFLILSAIGCYYSYSKNISFLNFIKKRFKRIVIPYLFVCIPFWFIADIVQKKSFLRFVLDLSGASLFTGTRTFWYVFFILAMYLLFPLIYKIFENKNRNIYFIFIELLVISITLFIQFNFKDLYNNIQVFILRIPIFIFAIYIAKYVKENKKIPALLIICVILTLFISPLGLNKTLMRYLNSLQALGACIVIVFILSKVKLEKTKGILRNIGKYSYEVYLLHITFRRIFLNYSINVERISIYLLIILLTIVFSYLINRISNKLMTD